MEKNSEAREQRLLMIAMCGLIVATAVLALIGFLCLRKPSGFVEGMADATSVRISGKLPGRVVELYVKEGDMVRAGDTLVRIHSSVVDAKLQQAEAMERAAAAANEVVDEGTRPQIIQTAREVVAQSEAALTLATKTWHRMENLYNEGVISAQKRDEARAAYESAVAANKAAQSQLSLAIDGPRHGDKAASAAMVGVARGGVDEVEALLQDQYLVAPCDGQIDQVYPEVSELVSLGTPIMSLLKVDDKWVTFNVRETELDGLKIGDDITVKVPALRMKEVKCRVYYIRDLGTYAAWRATKATGQWDARTFEVKARPVQEIEELRPGMTVLLDK